MSIIFENSYYRILRHTPEAPSNVSVICYEYFVEGNHDILPGPFGPVVAKDSFLGIGFNYIVIQTRANNFYQADGILESLEVIAKIKKEGDIYISYGVSMGGFAAINFSNHVKSDIFLAIAPLVSLNPKLVEKISEYRSLKVSKIFNYDFIINDECKEALGIIIYDPDFGIDAMHAEILKNKTAGEIIYGPGGGHTSGQVVNKYYGLKNLIKELPNCVGSRKKLANLSIAVNKLIEANRS